MTASNAEPIAVTLLIADIFESLAVSYFVGSRAQRIVVSESPARSLVFATAEDVVLEKLRWYRLGGEISDRQWNDVLGVLRTSADKIDVAYLREQAPAIAVSDLLERALADAGLRTTND